VSAATTRATFIVAAHVLFVRDGEVLLLRRFNTGYEDGNYSVPAGHVEADESPSRAAAREAREEVGLEIARDAGMSLALVIHRRTEEPRIDFFFEVTRWVGDVRNLEPEKCDELRWASLDALPENMVPYVRHAIECYKAGMNYATFG
jgi:ADP-ribose pyrophosphatase YjhB (NUDIX family)